MVWPEAQDFRESVQNPAFCFKDLELKQGRIFLDKMGLPSVNSGRFASVYSVDVGGKRLAVRCFNCNLEDQRERYQAIARALSVAGLPYTVGFEYQPDGILVNGKWYPLLKMEWVEGEPLLKYVESNLGNKDALVMLLDQWLVMSRRFDAASIAHGDLQHGNVLISNRQIKLVDYDGMFVPELTGQPTHELGHANYQHPKRNHGRLFGPFLDNFSHWLIYSSIQCLAMDPGLWQAVPNHDEVILLRESDFRNPDDSPIVAMLRNHSDPRIQQVAEKLSELLELEPDEIPGLDSTAQSVSGLAPLEKQLEVLGLYAGVPPRKIHEAYKIWHKVWAAQNYSVNKELTRRAYVKLRDVRSAYEGICKKLHLTPVTH